MTGGRIRLGIALLAGLLTACGSTTPASDTPLPPPTTAALADQLDDLEEAVKTWRAATSIEQAHEAAETAANLIVGPNGPGYGDRDGNGDVQGQTPAGILQGGDGTPPGLADALASNQCVVDNVLGGDWDDPAERWGIMLDTIDRWKPGNNTMPTLPSHPMRVVGWATFTLETRSLDEAHEYAGHAKLHVDISIRALDC